MEIEDIKILAQSSPPFEGMTFSIVGDGVTIQTEVEIIDGGHLKVVCSIHPDILDTLIDMQSAIDTLKERALNNEDEN